MGQDASKPTDLSPELKVIGAGFSRTGTVTLALALERLLNGPVCHGGTAFLKREEAFVEKWTRIQDKKIAEKVMKKNLRDLTAGYVACTDMPAIVFTEELCDIYPDAIVICTTRDPLNWYESAKFVMKVPNLWWLDILFLPMPILRRFGAWRDTLTDRLETVYGCSKDDMNGPQLLTMHEDYIRRVVPKERLFWFNVKDGWEPLCKILNCPVPDDPFPRANDKNAMHEFFESIIKKSIMRWLQILGGVGGTLGMAWWGLTRVKVH